MLSSDLWCAVPLADREKARVRFGLSPRAKSFASLQVLLPWPCCCDGASAALAGNAGRSESWSVAGQALSHGYRADPDRQAAHRWPACCVRPQRGPLRSAPWQANGSPARHAWALQYRGNCASHYVKVALARRPPRSTGLGWCGPRQLRAFSLCAGRWRAAVKA